MKRLSMFILACLLLLGAVSAFAGDVPDLTGKWKAESVALYRQGKGFVENTSPESYLVVKEQKGRLFHGVKMWTVDGKERSEVVNGVVTHKNEILVSETDDGFCHGDLMSPDEMILYYMEPGKDAKTIMYTYKRIR
ncbi:hypothetical protein [Salidesulfovibrio onnuriiensis]|uniref:hypothetical protein n=1 Tax=Salidesulfovibrio onnuriiensis TaxID=2583823 RepID=UPI0011CBD916|nr:hypothetical protein [Salidesulfovibrio onnuriiensis]